MFDLNLLFQTQSNALFIPAPQTLCSTWTGKAHLFSATSTSIIWLVRTADHLEPCQVSKPTLVQLLFLQHRLVVMCTALMQGSALFFLKRGHQLLQGRKQGEEEQLLLQGDEGARRDEERKKIVIHTRIGGGLPSSRGLIMNLCTIRSKYNYYQHLS